MFFEGNKKSTIIILITEIIIKGRELLRKENNGTGITWQGERKLTQEFGNVKLATGNSEK